MPKSIYYHHLTFADRVHIQAGLECSTPLASIARHIGCSPSSIGREILRNRTDAGRRHAFGGSQICKYRFECQKKKLCSGCWNRRCSSCIKKNCSKICRQYEEDVCRIVTRAPFCCNGCEETRKCTLHRFAYDAKIAQALADKRLSEERAGINITPQEFERIHDLVWPLVRDKGQSFAHIWASHAGEIGLSERTFYRYVTLGLGGMMKIKLPRAMRYKVRASNDSRRPKVDMTARNYSDFEALDVETQLTAAEIDCVIGKQSDKQCLLTMLLRPSKLLLVFVLKEKTSAQVASVFDYLEVELGSDFKKLFATVIADRGSEFIDFSAIERSVKGKEKRLNLYYTDPMRPSQKPSVECAHLLVRRILPKGKGGISFDNLDNFDAATIMCHVNSYARKSLGGASAFSITEHMYGSDVIDALGLSYVFPDEVVLKPSIIKSSRP